MGRVLKEVLMDLKFSKIVVSMVYDCLIITDQRRMSVGRSEAPER